MSSSSSIVSDLEDKLTLEDSEDSDSEEEKNHALTKEEKKESEAFVARSQSDKNKVRQEIYRTSTLKKGAIEDLDFLNKEIKEGKPLADILKRLPHKTPFFVAQYRGVHYRTDYWNTPSRRKHRSLDERKKTQYSEAVFDLAKVDIFQKLAEINLEATKIKAALNEESERVRQGLLRLREQGLTFYKGVGSEGNWLFPNVAYCLQDIYSKGYKKFMKKLDEIIEKYPENIFTTVNPFVSTGDVPSHALGYAYGLKLYDGYEEARLKPQWKQNGYARCSHVGKVYISLHSLLDFAGEDNPLCLITAEQLAFVHLNTVTLPERETTFPGYLPSDRVFAQHIAKFPSFKKYKQIYLRKYGIDPETFNVLNTSRRNNPSDFETSSKLGESLRQYHEVRLIALAEKEAISRGGILIYKAPNGGYSFRWPLAKVLPNSTPTKSAQIELTGIISRNLSSSSGGSITIVSPEAVKTWIGQSDSPNKDALITRTDSMNSARRTPSLSSSSSGSSVGSLTRGDTIDPDALPINPDLDIPRGESSAASSSDPIPPSLSSRTPTTVIERDSISSAGGAAAMAVHGLLPGLTNMSVSTNKPTPSTPTPKKN